VTVALDHLIVAAHTLEQGAAWCEATLGVTPNAGGKHPLMGTHNRVFKIASAAYPLLYFEIIAIDPDAPPPPHPRWFGLDGEDLQTSLRDQGPRLIHAVARSTMLDMHRWGLITVGQVPGDPVDLSRAAPDGTLQWQMLVRKDGGLDCAGALPTLLQWKGRHPAEAMPDAGVTLSALALNGISARARDVLRLRGVAVSPTGSPALRATLSTPKGEVTLESHP
jgi:hypothetical protein